MQALPRTGGGFDQHFPKTLEELLSTYFMGQLVVPLKPCLRQFLSTQAVCHLLMPMAGSEHLQDKTTELKGLKDGAGQESGVREKNNQAKP